MATLVAILIYDSCAYFREGTTFWIAQHSSHNASRRGNYPMEWSTYRRFSCRTLQLFNQFGIVYVQLVGGAVMTMRVYAFYEKSRRILLFLFTVSVVVISLACTTYGQWAILFDSSSLVPSDPRITLGQRYTHGFQRALRLAIAWTGHLGFDVIIFVLTLWKSLHIGKVGDRTLIDTLLYDGSLYFGWQHHQKINSHCVHMRILRHNDLAADAQPPGTKTTENADVSDTDARHQQLAAGDYSSCPRRMLLRRCVWRTLVYALVEVRELVTKRGWFVGLTFRCHAIASGGWRYEGLRGITTIFLYHSYTRARYL
ncbi:hypothetical protein BU15DRAFT_61458 [Melanogaster broomeanus]|nr:hypothetical protein BU15DRAFT_61458 [Melanogaster broomeanus]